MSDTKYNLNTESVVYETELFLIDVGLFPEEELELYRIHNKDTGVIEYAHSVLFYAKQWTDMATKILKGEEPGFLMDMDKPDFPGVN